MFQPNHNDLVIAEITNDDTKGDSPRSPCKVVATPEPIHNLSTFPQVKTLDEYSQRLDLNNKYRPSSKSSTLDMKSTGILQQIHQV